MTLEQFLEKLKQTPRDWCLRRDGLIRRGDLGTNAYSCPLCAVAGHDGNGLAWSSAGVKLNIPGTVVREIKDAADNGGPSFSEEVRAQLLEACGLPANV